MGCTSCKKKKVAETTEELPSWEEIKQAYDDLTSYAGVKPEKYESINKVYQALFGEQFNFKCGGCASYQANRFHNYITRNAEGKSS